MATERQVRDTRAFEILVQRAEALLRAERALSRCCLALREATLKRDIPAIRQQIEGVRGRLAELDTETGSILDRCSEEASSRLSEADTDRAFRQAAQEAGLHVTGSYPRYYVPPVEVIFFREKGTTIIGSHTVRSTHPLLVASAVSDERRQLETHGYPPETLGPLIVRAHELLVSESAQHTGKPLQQVPIRELHSLIRTFSCRGEYTTTQFGYDIARLREFMGTKPMDPTPLFGDTRHASRGIPVPGPSSMQRVGYVEIQRGGRR